MLVLASSSITAGALLFGWISAKHCHCSIAERLGLRWPKISAWSMVGLLLGSVPVLLIAVGAVMLIETVLPGDDSVLKLYKNQPNRRAASNVIVNAVRMVNRGRRLVRSEVMLIANRPVGKRLTRATLPRNTFA